jgi:tungstate transport system substrate-binding protein
LKKGSAMRCLKLLLPLLLALLAGCGAATAPADGPVASPIATASNAPSTQADAAPSTLRLATTTSTADSGLLDAILPDFEQQHNANVDVIAVGTGQALALGESGDIDVVLVHARKREDEFVASGQGINRRDVMYNDFVLVGLTDDPAGAATTETAADAFRVIADAESTFTSRGDDSGTYTKEQTIWASSGITPTAELGWYKSLGQGMGETLIVADEQGAYTLSDRGTFLAMRDRLPDLTVVVGGETIEQNPDPMLRNPYGVIQVNPDRHDGINAQLAATFVDWITSPATQQRIGAFGREQYGQPLFYPSATP